MADGTWARYYQAVQGREPRALFLAALAAFEASPERQVLSFSKRRMYAPS